MTHYQHHTRSILKDPNASISNNVAIWKKVCFDDVHIREYPIILGDNPAVSKGAPVQIDWDYHNEDVIDVDIYEQCREPERRHRKRIVLSARKRAKMLLGAGHSVEEIADMTLQCQTVKRMRVESLKSVGQWEFGNLNVNLADFMTGTAEVTGRTLKLVGLDAMAGALNASGQAVGKAGLAVVTGTGKMVMGTGKAAGDVVLGTGKFAGDVVLGTGKFASDVVVGTGKLGVDVVVGTGRVVGDVALGTGKVGLEVVKGTGKVVVGTGRLATDAVVGTGQMLMKGTETVVKGIGKAPRRITSIFSQADFVRGDELKQTKERLRHIDSARQAAAVGTLSPRSPKSSNSPKSRSPKRADTSASSRKSRRNTEISPTRGRSSRPIPKLNEDNVMDELAQMEQFMRHLKDMDPEHVKQVLNDHIIQT